MTKDDFRNFYAIPLNIFCFIILLLTINPIEANETGDTWQQSIKHVAEVIRVGDGDNCDYGTIQAAIIVIENPSFNYTGTIHIRVTNQHDWVENINLTNDLSANLGIYGGYEDCNANNAGSNFSIIKVFNANEPGVYIKDYTNIRYKNLSLPTQTHLEYKL